MAKALPEEQSRFENPDSLTAKVREYVKVQSTIDFMGSRRLELRDQLFQQLDDEGFEDDKGNLIIDFDEPIEGVIRLEKQRRTKRTLNEDRATELLKEKALDQKVLKTVQVIDEDALMELVWAGDVTEDELEEMYPLTVTWALTPKKQAVRKSKR